MHVNDNILLFFKIICTAANAVTTVTYVFYVTQAIAVCLITKQNTRNRICAKLRSKHTSELQLQLKYKYSSFEFK